MEDWQQNNKKKKINLYAFITFDMCVNIISLPDWKSWMPSWKKKDEENFENKNSYFMQSDD